ncbi:MAG: TrbI/VirB10 family protein [Candidatus Eisenbacteria bacterium]|uniref:TrbI/VirB10 family protein n=1 Tax=Eiseniibacteriota bacterium TaxID=2212470 RepID=A0A538TDX2_UNCEI|nr:MAG: TrbI/VirB10 family protein [Candidatus Eisenbacteria bacterium]
MKRIAGSIGIAVFIILAAASTGCTKSDAVADAKTQAAQENQASAPSQETLVVPAGTHFLAVLDTRLSTDANSTGDPFVARTIEPIVIDGRTVVPAGSRINGVLRDVQASGRIKDRARMTLVFSEMTDSAGKMHSMSAQPLTIKAASETHNDVLKIAGGSAAGAVLGAISGKKNGAVIGAAAGAGAGTILVLATKGDDVELNQGLKLYVEMTGPTDFVVAAQK